MTFDRLIYIGRLKEAGLTEPVARAHAEALRDALFETVATREDLKEAADRLDRKIDGVEERLDRKIEGVAVALDRKIEISARDLVIKGAAGLVVIASIIIGLKLFG